MLKKKIIASSLNNLTDARYFAGWMVDYFIFNINPEDAKYINPQEIGVLKSWVEGPKYFLDMSADQLPNAEKYLVDLGCDGLVIDFDQRHLIASIDVPCIFRISEEDFISNNELINSLESDVIILVDGSLDSILKYLTTEQNIIAEDKNVYINIVNQQLTEDEILHDSLSGFVVHGSPEEKVGYKSFDELDELFEVLQDF